MKCTHCTSPLFAITPAVDRLRPGIGSGAAAECRLANKRIWVRDGSVWVRGRCEVCRFVNTIRDPAALLTPLLDAYNVRIAAEKAHHEAGIYAA